MNARPVRRGVSPLPPRSERRPQQCSVPRSPAQKPTGFHTFAPRPPGGEAIKIDRHQRPAEQNVGAGTMPTIEGTGSLQARDGKLCKRENAADRREDQRINAPRPEQWPNPHAHALLAFLTRIVCVPRPFALWKRKERLELHKGIAQTFSRAGRPPFGAYGTRPPAFPRSPFHIPFLFLQK